MKITQFAYPTGQVLAGKYQIVTQLGCGWEGEVYLVRELGTGIDRAAKLFFPSRNRNNKVSRAYAKKLHRLRRCESLVQYVNQETITFQGQQVALLVSEFVDGEPLNHYLAKQRGRRLPEFEALHLLHALAKGLEPIHAAREYHGDLHGENVMVYRTGLRYQIKLLDFYIRRESTQRENIQDDVCDMARLLYDLIGGRRFYARQSPQIKGICCGLKRTLIVRKFRHAGRLRQHLETLQWL